MSSLSRRALLGSGVTGGILTAAAAAAAEGGFGNPDQPAEGAVNVTNPKALTDPGPQDPEPCRQRASFPRPAGHRRQRHAAVLGFVQSCSQTNPEWRLGAADHPG